MAEPVEACSDRLELAKALVRHLETGNEHDADEALAALAGFNENRLYQEVGRLTRELHNAMKEFLLDSRLTEIVETEIPDAAERLRYVIAMTEQAANATLGAVEDSLPLADALRSGSHDLLQQWQRFKTQTRSGDGFRAMDLELSEFLAVTQAHSTQLHENLSEVLVAQGFQDLTGQVIRRVIDLVNDVERQLITLIRLAGAQVHQGGRSPSAPEGPVVPGVDNGDVVRDQDEVDDLLSSLGF